MHIVAVYVILERTHVNSRFKEENGVSQRGLMFTKLKPTWCIQRKESINITSIMRKLCENGHTLKTKRF